ncbi:MAG: hypothetical protein JRH15_20000, partial [Deltaproteobacteria bacterium]|nr:hypothetical protein [Deltaproteobacteria bacterium]
GNFGILKKSSGKSSDTPKRPHGTVGSPAGKNAPFITCKTGQTGIFTARIITIEIATMTGPASIITTRIINTGITTETDTDAAAKLTIAIKGGNVVMYIPDIGPMDMAFHLLTDSFFPAHGPIPMGILDSRPVVIGKNTVGIPAV